ncbi:MAG: STAS domain-containing protein [Verrucomicrobiota bacterium]
MPNPSPALFVTVVGPVAFVKIGGRANFTASADFKKLVGALRQHGLEKFVLDLTDCITMDSTFLGVLSGLALKIKEATQKSENARLELLNPNQRVADLLENLGVGHLFVFVQGCCPVTAQLEPVPAEAASLSREQMSLNCLEAHQTLMQINPANIPKFKDVAQFLAEDLKKLKTPDQGSQ